MSRLSPFAHSLLRFWPACCSSAPTAAAMHHRRKAKIRQRPPHGLRPSRSRTRNQNPARQPHLPLRPANRRWRMCMPCSMRRSIWTIKTRR